MAVHRYWRVAGFSTPSGALSLSEFQLLNTAGTRVDASATLTAALTPPTSGSLASLKDGVATSSCRWANLSSGYGAYLTWDFGGSPVDVVGAVLGAGGSVDEWPTVFRLEYSDDGAQWTFPVYYRLIAYPGATTLTPSQYRLKFVYTGADQTLTVPSDVTSLQVKVWGAAGGSTIYSSYGGAGGYVVGEIATTPGESLVVMVGGVGTFSAANPIPGPYGGGGGGRWASGTAYSAANNSGSGGGRSAIRRSSADIITAGGGGGSGGFSVGQGGGGGGTTGQAGVAYSSFPGGTGGTQSAGGTGGGTGAGAGSQYHGGDGGQSTGEGGGGGGGYYGGGGGCANSSGGAGGGGGGGGSSYLGSATNASTLAGSATVPGNATDIDRGVAGAPTVSNVSGDGVVYVISPPIYATLGNSGTIASSTFPQWFGLTTQTRSPVVPGETIVVDIQGVTSGPIAPAVITSYFGYGYIQGHVKVISIPAPSRMVRLYHRESGRLIRTTYSDSEGKYAFFNLDERAKFFVAGFDTPLLQYNAAVKDWLTPATDPKYATPAAGASPALPYSPLLPPVVPAAPVTPSYSFILNLAGSYTPSSSPITLDLV